MNEDEGRVFALEGYAWHGKARVKKEGAWKPWDIEKEVVKRTGDRRQETGDRRIEWSDESFVSV